MSRKTAIRSAIPSFSLYGDAVAPAADMLHIESIQSRSRLHQWEIDTHRHQGLHQVLWLRSGPAAVSLDGLRQDAVGPLVVAMDAHGNSLYDEVSAGVEDNLARLKGKLGR